MNRFVLGDSWFPLELTLLVISAVSIVITAILFIQNYDRMCKTCLIESDKAQENNQQVCFHYHFVQLLYV